MAALDIHILNLIDYRPDNYRATISMYELYLPCMQQPTIEAMFLYPWDTGYEGNGTEKGSITWVNGKPIITGRIALWQTDGCKPTGMFGSSGCRNTINVANFLNAQAAQANGTDASSSAAYSVVLVDVWTTVGDVAAVMDVIARLRPNVKVVPADVLVKLIRQNGNH